MPTSSVYHIAADRPFVDELAKALLAEIKDCPEALPSYRVLLPTRRACRSLREAFLRASGGKALLLPLMTPIGDVDEDDLALAAGATGSIGATGQAIDDALQAHLPLAPAIGGLRRQLLLARLILADQSRAVTPDQAVMLAAELGAVLDQIQTERISLADIPKTFPGDLSIHWEKVLEFLNILLEFWPDVLKDEGRTDQAARRNDVLGALAALWQKNPPAGPVIAAGSTGSIPATADLLFVVASMEQGRVVLPGLDQVLDDESWATLEPTHPQWGLKQLLIRLGVDRHDVPPWAGRGGAAPERTKLVSELMRPAATSDQWARLDMDMATALDGLHRLDAPTPRDEAGAIALIMRSVLEAPKKRCALVTPDRQLARRVAALLTQWDIQVDDSAGLPLTQSEPGSFLRLLNEACQSQLAPAPMLALLKHPLCFLSRERSALLPLVRGLEKAALRGVRPAPGIAGVRAALGEKAEDFRNLLDDLEKALGPFQDLLQTKAPPSAFLAGLIAAAESLCPCDELWKGDAGETLSLFIADLVEAASDQPDIDGRSFPAWFDVLMLRAVVRSRYGMHPRLFIWGQMEARLQSVDVMILGGLNEGTWPAAVETGPWMSRPMLSEIGLPLPERRIGLSAHDFQQAFHAPEVWMTRSSRVDGSPTVPSRWLVRLDNLLQGFGGRDQIMDQQFLRWQEVRDRQRERQETPYPKPKPALSHRPKQLSVTAIETWIRDPYALYADKILRLRALDPIDADPGAADRGTIIHDVLEQFIRDHPKTLPGDALDQLMTIGRAQFDALSDRPTVRAFWWPRFQRIASWFIDAEMARRAEGWRPVLVEGQGAIKIEGPKEPFTVTAKADRIDKSPTGGLCIIDYKTGTPPSKKQVKTGLSPQLTLEALMAQQGGFEGLSAEPVTGLLYIKLSGGREPGAMTLIAEDIRDLIEDALDGLHRLVASYQNEKMPYLAKPRVQFQKRFNDYDHLSRSQAWEDGA